MVGILPPSMVNGNNAKPALSSTFDECTTKFMNKNNSIQLMKIYNNNKLIMGVLALTTASMTFAANGGMKPTFAQIAGITPPPSTDQGISNNATSGTTSNMSMSSASSGM